MDMARKIVYPEWVQAYRTHGKTIKKIGEQYYLYHHTSKRVPGKKYPIPVDTYIGVITPEGVIESKTKKVSTKSIIVKEYGFSYAMVHCCPEVWKDLVKNDYEMKLRRIIKKRSRFSYLEDIPGMEKYDDQLGTLTSTLRRHLLNAYGVTIDDLGILDSIFLVQMDGGKRFLSDIDSKQQELLDRLNLKLEV